MKKELNATTKFKNMKDSHDMMFNKISQTHKNTFHIISFFIGRQN